VNTLRAADPRATRLIRFYEALGPADVARLGEIYADTVHFKDPFNDVSGLAALQHIFAHMFVALDAPRFVVDEALVNGDQCFLTWRFLFRFKRGDPAEQVVHGASHVRFDAGGRVVMHRDYWDAAEELYEKLPLIGALMRWLKRRVNARV
jgi:steroid delta-isomerase